MEITEFMGTETRKDLVVLELPDGTKKALVYFVKNEEDEIYAYGASTGDIDDTVNDWNIEQFIQMALEDAPIPMYPESMGLKITIL